jgi:hypothetical protein
MQETLSDIYYKIHSYNKTASGMHAMQLCRAVHQLQAKLQCRWMQNATRDHFGGVGVWKITLSQLLIHTVVWVYWNPRESRNVTKQPE